MIWIIRAMQAICYLIVALVVALVPLLLINAGKIDYPWLKVAVSGPNEGIGYVGYITATLLAFAFFRLGRLMGQFAGKKYFSPAAVSHMRWFAGTYVLLSIGSFILARPSNAFAGEPGALNTFTGEDFFGLIMSLTLIIVAHVLNEARKNKEELDDYF